MPGARGPAGLVGLTLALVACGDGAPGPDASVAAIDAPTPAPCTTAFDRAYIVTEMRFLPEGEGRDLTGDGVIDNSLGFIAPIVNQAFRERFEGGLILFLFAMTGWDEPRADDPELVLTSFAARDADDPPDPSNNFGGAGQFEIYDSQLDVACHPLNVAPAQVSGGVLEARSQGWKFLVLDVGSIEFDELQLSFVFDPGFNGFSGALYTIFTSCGMGRFYLSPFGFGSVRGVVAASGRDPDIDVDGDGLEHIAVDDEIVTSCVDGDGTIIEGNDCACDPRIADGYSTGLTVVGMAATVVGIDEAP